MRRRAGAKRIAANPFVALLEATRPDVEARLTGLLDAKTDAVREHGPEVVELVEALGDLCLRGGKRLRAALLVTGYRAADRADDVEPALDAGVALELLHAYFLIHDDWMDEDRVRRGGPSVHAMLARRYRSAHLGASSAILAGDLGVALATEVLSRLDVPPRRLARGMATFARMQSDAVAGQQLDVVGRGVDVEKTYSLKTSSYTVRGPLVLGAQLAGAAPHVVRTLQRFAMPVGIAFQLRDDLISVFEDTTRTGKPFAGDIRAGKRTALIQEGFARAKGSGKRTLERAWGNQRATKPQLRSAVSVLESCGARSAIEARIAELSSTAVASVESSRVPKTAQELLVGAARALSDRRS